MAIVHKAVELGAGLNFKIVGGTVQPASPKENTIWINTDTPIGEYQFSATEPTTRADGTAFQNGDVWIRTVSNHYVFFNALKKNGIKVCPYMAYQFNGVEWSYKEAKLYQNEWKDFIRYIYRLGNEYEEVTQGWVGGYVSGTYYSTGTVTKNEESISLTASGKKAVVLRTSTPIEVTDFKTILIHVKSVKTSGSNNGVRIGLKSTDELKLDDTCMQYIANNASVTYTDKLYNLDISSVTGNMYPYVSINANESNSASIEFDEIYFL